MEIWQTPTLSGSTTDKPGNDNDSGSQPSQPNYSKALVSCIAGYNKFNLVNTASGNFSTDAAHGTFSGYVNKEVAFYAVIVPVASAQHQWVTELGNGTLLGTYDWVQGDGSSSCTIDFQSPETTGFFSAKGKNMTQDYEWRGSISGMFRGKLSISTSGRGNTDLKWKAFIFQVEPNVAANTYNQYALFSELSDQVTFSPETWTFDMTIQNLSYELHFTTGYAGYESAAYNSATWTTSFTAADTFVSKNFGVLRDYKYAGTIGTVCKYVARELSTSSASINTRVVDSGWQSIKIGGQENVKSK